MCNESKKGVCEAVRNNKVHQGANYNGRYRLSKRAENAFAMGYDPKMYVSPELNPDAVTCFQSIIGILKLGRIDKIIKLSLLLLHQVPKEKHLEAAVHVMVNI